VHIQTDKINEREREGSINHKASSHTSWRKTQPETAANLPHSSQILCCYEHAQLLKILKDKMSQQDGWPREAQVRGGPLLLLEFWLQHEGIFSTLLNFQADNILKDEKIDRQRAVVLSKFGDHIHKFTRTWNSSIKAWTRNERGMWGIWTWKYSNLTCFAYVLLGFVHILLVYTESPNGR